MADPNIGQVAATTYERVVRRVPEDNVFPSMALLYLLKNGNGFKKEDGGTLVEESVEYAENTTIKSVSDEETLDTTRVDVFDAFRFDWKNYAGTIVFTEPEKAKCAGSEAKIDDLIERKVNNGRNSMFHRLNLDFYGDGTGNGGKNVGGLGLLVAASPTTGSPGGVNRAVFPFARNRQIAGTKTTNAFDNLRGAMRNSYNSCSKGAQDDHPSLMIFDQTSFEGYESTLTINERFTTKAEADGGFKNETMKFKGAKVTFDEDCTAATGYTLNDAHLFFRYLEWCRAFPPVDPANQLTEVVKLWTMGCLTFNNPRRLGTITTIS